tara:strand:- start:2402 stop:2908 length:507 start_codon:yes stop_codon:yes gene_type:complete
MTNTVQLKRSSVANSIPSAGNLVAGELAINYTDGNLFYKNDSNVVTVIASNKFLSVSGNVTGNYFIGNGSQLTGINATSSQISNGTSNVAIVAASGNVQVAVAAVANSVVMGAGSLFVQGPISTPKTINTLALVPNEVNAVMISPLTISASGNIFVPTDSTLTIFTPI